MRRRDFITLLGGATLAVPQIARAQQKTARIGFLGLVSASSHASRTAALRAGLRDLGYIEGQTIALEIRWDEGKPERSPAHAAELVALPVDLIVTGTGVATGAAQHTTTIPIVMASHPEPVERRHVASLARPGATSLGCP